MTTLELTVGQVWQHRVDCFVCSRANDPIRHSYVIVHIRDDGVVLVRDLEQMHSGAFKRIGARYPIARDRFGGLQKGGLRLAGTLAGHKLDPVAEPDDRVIDHERVRMSRRTKVLARSAARGQYRAAPDLIEEAAA